MSIVALLLKNSNQIDLNMHSKFLDDDVYSDSDLPMKFHFINDVDE